MGWRVRRSYRIAPGVRVNVGKSGVTSVSTKLGKNLTVNSRRGATVRVAKGVSYTATPTAAPSGKRKKGVRYEDAVLSKAKGGGCCLWPFMLLLAMSAFAVFKIVRRFERGNT